jgi:hypothetical protein
MRFHSCRCLIAATTAVLIILSAVVHHAVVAGMSAESGMAMSAQASEMASHDAGAAPCPMSSDCAKDMSMHAMACFAHCATVVGVLGEPILVPVTAISHQLDLPLVRPLASLHGPPDSPPPKSPILI